MVITKLAVTHVVIKEILMGWGVSSIQTRSKSSGSVLYIAAR